MTISALFLLFFSAFTSATILPGTSEATLAAMVYHANDDIGLAWLIATLGNTLGSLVSYTMGFYGKKLMHRFRTVRQQMPSEKAQALLQRFGAWLLLFAWIPMIGDALPIAAGWLRLNIWLCALALLIGKGIRYATVVWIII